MKFKQHCEESLKLFGDEFECVHVWLDELAGKPGIGMKHRKFRHHKEGVRQVENIFGEAAAQTAFQHIKSDLKEEGWTEKDRFPENQNEYEKMGFF
jgi:hypothetical protein